MLGDLIKLFACTLFSAQNPQSPHVQMIKAVLALLIEHPKEPISTLHIGFANSEFYNYDYLEQILNQIATIHKTDI